MLNRIAMISLLATVGLVAVRTDAKDVTGEQEVINMQISVGGDCDNQVTIQLDGKACLIARKIILGKGEDAIELTADNRQIQISFRGHRITASSLELQTGFEEIQLEGMIIGRPKRN